MFASTCLHFTRKLGYLHFGYEQTEPTFKLKSNVSDTNQSNMTLASSSRTTKRLHTLIRWLFMHEKKMAKIVAQVSQEYTRK